MLGLARADRTRLGSGGGEALISGEGLAKSFGMDVLFEGLDVTISRGQKLGLLGRNGCGKSTLLRILAGMDAPDKGKVQRRRHLNLAFLAQDPDLPASLSLLDAVLSADNAAMRAVREYERAAQRMKGRDPTPSEAAALQRAMDGVEAMGAWDVVAEAEKLLEILGLGDAALRNGGGGGGGGGIMERQVSSLSGGQRKRVALAATLLAKPELIILDEPTNHMDVAVIDWMQSALSDPSLTVVLVSHDRYFLDAVCTQMLEIDRGTSFRHSGNYSTFLAARAKRAVEEAAAIGRAANTLRREGEWMRRMPKARSTKSRSRIDRFLALTKATTEKRQRQQQTAVGSVVEMGVGEARLGGKVLELRDATALRGESTVFEGFTYEFGRGDRLGVVGRNGAGKTTFLDALAGLLPLPSGTRDVGETVVMGYYTQHMPPVPDNMRVLDFVQNFNPTAAVLGSWGSIPAAAAAAAAAGSAAAGAGGSASGAAAVGAGSGAASMSGGSGSDEPVSASELLERFGFPRAKQYAWASKLSGGEKRRLLLAAVLAQRPNFLMLDEPTNDLDLQTIEAPQKPLLSLVDLHHCVLQGDGPEENAPPQQSNALRPIQCFETSQNTSSITSTAIQCFETSQNTSSITSTAIQCFETSQNTSSITSTAIQCFETSQNTSSITSTAIQCFETSQNTSSITSTAIQCSLSRLPPSPFALFPVTMLAFPCASLPFLPLLSSPIQALESFLSAYEGCLLVASHNRAFMDAVVDRQFVLQGDGQVLLYDGLFFAFQAASSCSFLVPPFPSFPSVCLPGSPVSFSPSPGSGVIPLGLRGLSASGLPRPCIHACRLASHDRAFMDAVVDRQFVLQGDGQVLLYDGLFSEYLADAQEQKAEKEKEEKERVAEDERRKEAEAKSVAEERRKGEEGAGSGGNKTKGKSARKMSYMERKEWERLEQEIEKLEKKKVVVEARLEEKSKAGDFAMLQGLSDELAALGQAIEAKSDRWLELAELAEE
ncbi:unnamed protein product [Closterium sp. NIES-54]